MAILAHYPRILGLSSLCLFAACGGKEGTTDSTGDADTGSASSGTAPTGTTGQDTAVTTGTTGDDTAITTGADGGNECASTCASEEECSVDEDASTGVGSDSCDDKSHCVVEMDCTCVLSFCELDCDPNDPATCEAGKTCDVDSGRCV